MTLRLALLLLVALAAACRQRAPDPKPEPTPAAPLATDPLLVVDGITVTFGDVEEAVAFFDRLDPSPSRRTKMQRVLEEFTLPLLFARREFAAERQTQLAAAQALCSVVGNAVELQQRSTLGTSRHATVTPRDVEIPIALFLFDPMHTGAVSPPLEVPQGFVVAGALDLQQSVVVPQDRCEAIQVGFLTHDAAAYARWLGELQQRLGDKATYVHPDYRAAMPQWLRLP